MVIQSAWLSLLSELRITNGISECHRYLAPLVNFIKTIRLIVEKRLCRKNQALFTVHCCFSLYVHIFRAVLLQKQL